MENEEKYQVWEKWNWTRGSLHNSCSMEQKMKNAPLFNPTTTTTEREEKKTVSWLADSNDVYFMAINILARLRYVVAAKTQLFV